MSGKCERSSTKGDVVFSTFRHVHNKGQEFFHDHRDHSEGELLLPQEQQRPPDDEEVDLC